MTVTFEDTDRDVIRVILYLSVQKGKTSLQSFLVPVAWAPDASANARGEASFSSNPKRTRDIGTECRWRMPEAIGATSCARSCSWTGRARGASSSVSRVSSVRRAAVLD